MYRKIKLKVKVKLRDEYTIDTLGVIVNTSRNVTIKGTSITLKNRYKKIHLDKFYPLHRLIALHFIPNPKNLPQVNHIDGNRNNNVASNLEWVSSKENVKHAYRHGLKTNNGEKNPISILTEEQVKSIWSLRKTDLTARQIRDRLNLSVSIDAVKKVRSGKNWFYLTSKLI